MNDFNIGKLHFYYKFFGNHFFLVLEISHVINHNMQAIILAGGFGTRLRAVVDDVPKPMADICGKPFLAHTISNFAQQGVTEIALSVHHLPHYIRDYFGDNYNGVKILYAEEDEPLGTGGALKHSLEILRPTKPVIATNGDTFVNINYASLYKVHIANRENITVVVKNMQNCERYGQVILENNIIQKFNPAGEGKGLINAGSYIINPDLFDDMPAKFSFENDCMKPYVGKIKPRGYITDGYFIDIGIPEDYKKACEELSCFI